MGRIIKDESDVYLRKVVSYELHHVRKYDAWAISTKIYDDARKNYAITRIEIYDEDNDIEYYIQSIFFDKLKFRGKLGDEDEQYFVPIKKWSKFSHDAGSPDRNKKIEDYLMGE